MASADPFASDPYDRIGVSKSDSLDDIGVVKDTLLREYLRKSQRADTQSETERYNDAFRNIEDAFEIIEAEKRGAHENYRLLTITVEPETVERGERVTIRVEDDRGSTVPDCTMQTRGRFRGRTDSDGTAKIQMRETGVITVRVSKEPDGDVSYRDTAFDVTVESMSHPGIAPT